MFCNQCGKPNPDSAVFCASCGKRFIPLEGFSPVPTSPSISSKDLTPNTNPVSSGKRKILWFFTTGLLCVIGIVGLLIFNGKIRVEALTSNLGKGKQGEPATTAATAPHPGEAVTNSLGMRFRYCPAGSFVSGVAKNTITFAKGFWMGETEVTQGQYQAVMGINPSKFTNVGPNAPVENVSWKDAQEFIKHLNEKDTAYSYRLPGSSEWEYACCAGTDAPNELFSSVAWYVNNSGSSTHPVGQKQANRWGIFDMQGNVFEWCEDPWHEDFAIPSDGSVWQGGDTSRRVVHGGAFDFPGIALHPWWRNGNPFEDRGDDLGFRIVCIPVSN